MKMTAKSLFKCILAVLTLWGAVLVGGTIIVYIWNFFSPARADAGSLKWYLLGIISSPIGVWLGETAMVKLTPEDAFIFLGVNLVVVAVFCACMILISYVAKSITLYYTLQNILTCVAAGGFAYYEFAQLRK
jgi:hypothetical protein